MPGYTITMGDIVMFRGGLFHVERRYEYAYDSIVKLTPVRINSTTEWYERDRTRRERTFVANIVASEADLRAPTAGHPAGPRAQVH